VSEKCTEVISCCLETVKSFRLPNVVLNQKSTANQRVFVYLFHLADEDGYVELDINNCSNSCGFSRTTVFKALRFLSRVNLLVKDSFNTGRGRHSTYRLRWRRVAKFPRKCKPIREFKKRKSINDLRVKDRPTGHQISILTDGVRDRIRKGLDTSARRWALKTIRWSAWSEGLSIEEQRCVTQAAGKFIWRAPTALIDGLIERVRQFISHEWQGVRDWLWRIKRTAGIVTMRRALYALLRKVISRIESGVKHEIDEFESFKREFDAAEASLKSWVTSLGDLTKAERVHIADESLKIRRMALQALSV